MRKLNLFNKKKKLNNILSFQNRQKKDLVASRAIRTRALDEKKRKKNTKNLKKATKNPNIQIAKKVRTKEEVKGIDKGVEVAREVENESNMDTVSNKAERKMKKS